MNIYLQLTEEFNRGRLRALLSGGQAVVLHRLAMMSKDGDWILREDDESMCHIMGNLERRGAFFRFGAPLDVRWMAGGWSAHLEFEDDGMRVRCDFVTRPPRLPSGRLDCLWREKEGVRHPCLDAADLIETKKTNREKDYAVIGELARMLRGTEEKLLYSRSATDLMELAAQWPDEIGRFMKRRPALAAITKGVEDLEAALDAERRKLMHANEERLARYMEAAQDWAREWNAVCREVDGLSLSAAHDVIVKRAEGVLPFQVPGGGV